MATVLVTGSSTGIGLAAAVTLARAGNTVFAGAWNPDGAKELHAAIAAERLPITVVRLDVDRDDSVRDAVRQVQAQGPVEALVNNAGIAVFGVIEDLPLNVFRKTMETNYFGALRCIKAVLPAMRERRSGCIVNVTSIGGRLVIAAHGSYCASKFALEAASEALAQEVTGFNIRVAIVEPGVTQSALFGKLPEEQPRSAYPHEARLRALHAAALVNAPSPLVVGEVIRRIIEGDSWQLRYPVGPGVAAAIARNGTLDDEEWYARRKHDTGVDAWPYRNVRSVARGV